MQNPSPTRPAAGPEREAATREILAAISQSRDDERPVFDAVLRNAAALCRAPMAWLLLCDDAQTEMTLAAYHGLARRALEIGDTWPLRVDPESQAGLGRAIVEARTTQDEDLAQTPFYLQGDASVRQLVDEEGLRTRMSVPLVSGGRGIGAIVLSRREVAPFGPEDMALLDTFAEQAVIAIENVRQFRELQTRLAREAATREILEVISQSRDDDRPVFHAVLRNANRLCGTSMAYLVLGRPEDTHMTLAAYVNPHLSSEDSVEQIIAFANQTGMRMDAAQHFSARAILSGEVVQIADIAASQGYLSGEPTTRILVEDVGVRSILSVPLFDAQGAIGAISLQRREERPFSDDEISLIQSFAAQAVIAIENVHQFRELQTRLEREAATREILEVISQSRDDDRPVFDAILSNAIRLCGGDTAALVLGRPDDPRLTLAAWNDRNTLSKAEADAMIAEVNSLDLVMDPALHVSAEAICSAKVVHLVDVMQSPGYLSGEPTFLTMVKDLRVRSMLSVPLCDARGALGAINVHRNEVRPFLADEIALMQSFAAQAVIAIENVRQFRELQARLEREAATRNILRVISESPDDEQPTFEAILDSATRLCGTQYAGLVLGRRGDTSQKLVAHRASTPETLTLYQDAKVPMDPEDSIAARAILEGKTIQVPDMADTDAYRAGHERFRLVVDRQGIRTNLFVPLLGPDGGIGCFILWKKDVAPFTADQIALVETFASHAVIAIENVRQFRALETLNAELGDRVQDQVGEIERMGRLKRFLPAAVADTVISSGSDKMLSSHRALLGVLFCDIRGFTAFCETAEPEETIEVLQTYHEEMGKLINAHGAGVDHRMGDGIMVLFNDPLPCDDPAGDAVRLGIAMRGRMAELCLRWKRMGHRLGFGVGVSLGYATVGMVGFEGRLDHTASGTAINLASRLCDEALDGEILLSPRARLAVEDDFAVESRGDITFKGIREPVEVFRLVEGTGGA